MQNYLLYVSQSSIFLLCIGILSLLVLSATAVLRDVLYWAGLRLPKVWDSPKGVTDFKAVLTCLELRANTWSISNLPPTLSRALPWDPTECDCRAESCLPRSPEEERLLLSGCLCVQGMCSLTPAAYAEAQEASWYYFSCFSAQISLKLEFGNKNILKAYLQTEIWIPWRVKYILSVTVCCARRCWHGTR